MGFQHSAQHPTCRFRPGGPEVCTCSSPTLSTEVLVCSPDTTVFEMDLLD